MTFFTDRISVNAICQFCKEPRFREELYDHFYLNDKLTTLYFMKKYIKPLIRQEVLEYAISYLMRSKNQKNSI